MEKLIASCYEKLMRFPTSDETLYLEKHGMDASWINHHYLEIQIAMMHKHYQGIPIDKPLFNLIPRFDEAYQFFVFLMDIHNRMMYKNPLMSDMGQFFAWLRIYGMGSAVELVKNWVLDQNEYKYQTECLQKLISWSDGTDSLIHRAGMLRVRFYGPYGTTGYARAFRDIVSCLASRQQEYDIRLSYVPLTVQEFNPDDTNPENLLLSRLLESRDMDVIRSGTFVDEVDVVLIHSVPDLWQPIVRRERAMNPNVRTIGMTVWETDHFPFPWHPHFYAVDRVTFPNRWNVQAALLDVPGVESTFLPHPVIRPQIREMPEGHEVPGSLQTLVQMKQDDPNLYVFYTVNEFSGRKGLNLMIRSYMREFSKNDRVLLFIKTHGQVREDVAVQLIDRLREETHEEDNDPAIILDYTRWSDDDINQLHLLADCFVSLTRSEGHGLGACMAAILGKRVIMTQFGGQTDYLRDIDYVPYTMVPASFCSLFDARHLGCLDMPSCKYFPFFLPTQQNWALPNEPASRRLMRAAYKDRLVGKASTISFLEEVCSSRKVGDNFSSYLHETLTCVQRRVPPALTQDTYKRSSGFFCNQRDIIAKQDLILAENYLFGKRPHVTIIGCFFYGNVGDDLYAALHEHFLSFDFDVHLVNTTTYLSKTTGKLQYVDKFKEGDLHPTDYVVIGGGGLINDAEINSSIFRVYFPYCVENNIPISLISVGFGFKSRDGKSPQLTPAVRSTFGPLFERANIITVRSVLDHDLALTMVPLERHFRVKLLPDLAFGAAEVFEVAEKKPSILPDKYVVFSPTVFNSVQMPDVAILIRRKLWENPGAKLLMLPMEGVDNADTYPTDFVKAETQRIKRMFPDALFYRGRYLTGEFLELSGKNIPSDATSQSIGACIDIFRHASAVVTGRYHGLVLAKLFGIDVDTGSSDIVKIAEELSSPLCMEKWADHYRLLKSDIVAETCVPEENRVAIDKNPDDWDEDMRNTTIVDIVTQTPPPSWSHTVSFVQSFSNMQLWSRRKETLTETFCMHK